MECPIGEKDARNNNNNNNNTSNSIRENILAAVRASNRKQLDECIAQYEKELLLNNDTPTNDEVKEKIRVLLNEGYLLPPNNKKRDLLLNIAVTRQSLSMVGNGTMIDSIINLEQ